MPQGSASIVVNRQPAEVFQALADVTRMGDWSPECTGGRWIDPATGPAVGATFEGDNVAKAGPITLKSWTTTSEITEYEPDRIIEFLAAGQTTWRYELEDRDGATSVTESFSHDPYQGWQKWVYGVLAQREKAMVKGMQRTLARLKATLEAG